jgi:hypothetical protein
MPFEELTSGKIDSSAIGFVALDCSAGCEQANRSNHML